MQNTFKKLAPKEHFYSLFRNRCRTFSNYNRWRFLNILPTYMTWHSFKSSRRNNSNILFYH